MRRSLALAALATVMSGRAVPARGDDTPAAPPAQPVSAPAEPVPTPVAPVPTEPARAPTAAETRTPSETVVSAKRDPDAPREDRSAAASVVIPADSPRAFDDLGTILLEVPGVTATRTGSMGAFSTITIRGSSPDEVRIYLDGVPLNLAAGGAVDISTLPLGDVERVEVYRGTSPLGFGESALGGIVAITTRTPVEPRLELRAGAGSFGTQFADLTGGSRVGRLRLYAGVHGLSTLGDYGYLNDNGTAANPNDDVYMPRQNNDLREANGVLRALLALAGRRTLQLGGVAFAREQGLPGIGKNPTVNARLATTRALGYLRYQSRDDLGPGGQLSAQVYVSDQRDRTRDIDGELGVGGPRDTHNVSQALGAIVSGGRPVADWLRVAAVLEGRRETFAPVNALDTVPIGLPARRLTAVAGGELDLFWRWADVNIVPSARIELVNDLVTRGATAAPAVTHRQPILRVGLMRPLGAHAMVKANAGRYARMPSFLELYGDATGRLLGNPDLTPESGTNADVALWIDRGGVTSRTGVHGALVDELIQWQPSSWGQSRSGNLARARIWGIEQELRLTLGRYLRAVAQVSYLDAVDDSADSVSRGRRLSFRPRVSGYLRPAIVRVPLPAGLELAAYVDADLRSQIYGDPDNVLVLGARLLLGAGVTLAAPRADLRLTASAANLTGDRQPDFLDWALPGRTLFVTLAYAPIGAGRDGHSATFDPRTGP